MRQYDRFTSPRMFTIKEDRPVSVSYGGVTRLAKVELVGVNRDGRIIILTFNDDEQDQMRIYL